MFEKNFFKKSECHRDGQTKAGHKGDIKPEVEDEAMEVEAAIDEQIKELEGVIKDLKGVKDLPKAKAQLETWESELKQLKEQQRHARPLPARLQAVTGRLAKASTLQQELGDKVTSLREQLAAAELDLPSSWDLARPVVLSRDGYGDPRIRRPRMPG